MVRVTAHALLTLTIPQVDYEEAPNVFQQMNLNTAPILYHFGPKLQGKKKPEQMDFQVGSRHTRISLSHLHLAPYSPFPSEYEGWFKL